jgi:hypothetical protein
MTSPDCDLCLEDFLLMLTLDDDFGNWQAVDWYIKRLLHETSGK